jgi:uncharacterized damage-inducible protein DinB
MESALSLPDDTLDRPFEMGMGCLRGTLEHLWRAERWWLDRWQGSLGDLGPSERELGIAALRDRFRATARQRNDFLDGLGAPGESKRITFTRPDGASREYPLGDMMLHVCNHGFHHRAQALNMLRHVGADAPDIDYLWLKLHSTPPPATDFDPPTIAEYYRYNDWARDRVLAAVEMLDDDGLERPFDMGLGSARKTLLHTCDAEQWWFQNWSGTPADDYEQLPETLSIGELRECFVETARRRNDLLATLDNAGLQREVRATPPGGNELVFTLGDTMLQLCGHGAHHRAQLLNMLRHIGAETPELDYADWMKAGQP